MRRCHSVPAPFFCGDCMQSCIYAGYGAHMSACNVLFFVVVFVRVTTSIYITYEQTKQLPECQDGLIEPMSPEVLAAKYIVGGDKAFSWFCPSFGELTRDIDVYSCASGDESSCLKKTEKICDVEIWTMEQCRDYMSFWNFRKRVKTCMPWETNPLIEGGWQSFEHSLTGANFGYGDFDGRDKTGMTHLRTQFTTFKPLWSWRGLPPAPQDKAVQSCVSGVDEIQFASQACWHSDDVLFLKPRYKFKFIPSNNKKLCVLSNTDKVLGTDILSFMNNVLTYTPQSAAIQKKFTICKWWGKDLEWWQEIYRNLIDDTWQEKEIQYLDYKSEATSTPCTDSVTEPCIDNVFSFFASECVWVRQPATLLSTMLGQFETEYKEKFEAYGDRTYVMNVGSRNIDAWVGSEKWNGEARYLDPSTTLVRVTAKTGYSCSGCDGFGQAQSPTGQGAPCGVPRKCDTCQAWQHVFLKGTENNCGQPNRECQECPAHEMSAGSGVETQYTCMACPPLTPMRKSGNLACEVCQHTQYFDAKSKDGCVFFESVADGLVFSGGSLFNAQFVDKFRPPGSLRAPEALPAEHYRNLAADGNKWNASTSAQRCSSSSEFVLNASVAGVFMRNVYGRRMQYRSFCGHFEMIKSGDAMVQALDCVSGAIRLSELVSRGGAYELEHRLVDNRMAEIKRTVGGTDCFYELRREGRTDNCRYCAGTEYTSDCGPTYYAGLAAPSVPGAGTCVACAETCPEPNSFFAVSEFSCWSNGTQRVRGDATHGSLRGLQAALSTSMNYWYKPAECRTCAGLSDAVGGTGVPQIVTRCGNKATFETWSDNEEMVLAVARPQRIVCCVLDAVVGTGVYYNHNKLVKCVAANDENLLGMTGNTPLCKTVVPDLETTYAPFCPAGWFLDKSAPGCTGVLEKWSNACCSKCARCEGAGRLQTSEYKLCPGDTAHDTQLAGCVTTCAEQNYQVGETCRACESCA